MSWGTVRQIAKELGMTPSALWKHKYRGKLNTIKVGKRVFVNREMPFKITDGVRLDVDFMKVEDYDSKLYKDISFIKEVVK